MCIIDIKPLSVNDAWQGRRFKTKEHKQWERDVLFLLPRFTMPEPPYEIYLRFGFSSSASDIDNPVKQTIDVLAKKYQFNDKLIHRAVIEKVKVEKGREFIQWDLTTLKT